MKIKPIASSSAGNAYLIDDGYSRILIECGISIDKLKIETNFFIPKINGCLISHFHKDHSKSAGELMKLGVDCYMTAETSAELEADSHFLRIIEPMKIFTVGTFTLQALPLHHDVPCVGFNILSQKTGETLFFATDTHYIQYKFKSKLDYIMVEANFDLDIINKQIIDGDYNSVAKERLMKSHMEINSTILWLKRQNLCGCKRVYLLHLSNGSANAADFRRRVIKETGIPCTVCPV